MGAAKRRNHVKGKEETHKGTVFSVTIVGAVILITYFIVFSLYMGRV